MGHDDERLRFEPLDCGDNSCVFAFDKRGMRTNGGCRCLREELPAKLMSRVHATVARWRAREKTARETQSLLEARIGELTNERDAWRIALSSVFEHPLGAPFMPDAAVQAVRGLREQIETQARHVSGLEAEIRELRAELLTRESFGKD